jgi:hypothetical protein
MPNGATADAREAAVRVSEGSVNSHTSWALITTNPTVNTSVLRFAQIDPAFVVVRAASTTNVSLPTTPATLDGVTLAAGDRALLKDQSTAKENGVYLCSNAGNLERIGDTGAPGLTIRVTEGDRNRHSTWSRVVNGGVSLFSPQSTSFDLRDFGALGNGTTDDAGALSAAIAAIGSATGSIRVHAGSEGTSGQFRLGRSMSIPANVTVEFAGRGMLALDVGKTLTINGPVVATPRQQIFSFATIVVVGASGTPIQITTGGPHGLSTGDTVMISGVGGNQFANGVWTVNVSDATHFTLNGSSSSGTYSSGGTVRGFVNMTVQDLVWAHWFGARADSDTQGGGTPDDAAIQAAINSVSLQVSPGYAHPPTGNFGGSCVLLAPGNYRISTYIVIGAGIQFGGRGGTIFGSTTLYFDAQAGRDDDFGIDRGCLILERQVTPAINFARSDGCRVHDLVLYGHPSTRNALQNSGAGILVRTSGVKVYSPNSVLENIYVYGFPGHGISLAGDSAPNHHLTDGVTLLGSIFVNGCGGYGVFVHGGDSNANSFGGAVINVSSNGSWGVYEKSFLGNGWGTIEAHANGVRPHPHNAPTTWLTGDIDLSSKVWAPGRASNLGELVLPTLAYLGDPRHQSMARFQWRVQAVGSPAKFAGSSLKDEPDWASKSNLGETLTDANGNVFVAWQEEGGSYCRPAGVPGGTSSIVFLYAEADQQPPQLFNTAVLGANSEVWPECSLGIGDAIPRKGLAFGRNVRQDFYTLQDAGPLPARDPSTPVWIAIGGPFNDAGCAFFCRADPQVPSTPRDGTTLRAGSVNLTWHHDYPGTGVNLRWRPDYLRWQWRYGIFDEHTTCMISGGKVLPYPGAACFPHLWIGGNLSNGPLGLEARMTAVYPRLSPSFNPAMPALTTSALAPGGAFQPGDLVLNLTRTPTQMALYPVGWRPTRKTVAPPNAAWRAATHFAAGTVIQPGGAAGAICYRARTGGQTSSNQPSFDGANSFPDGELTWDPWGQADDFTAWDPVITESPTMLTKSIAGGASVTLTDDEAAHQRIQFTGTLTGNVTVTVPPGPATGWLRVFFNNTTGGFTLTVNGSVTDPGVAVPQTKSQMLWSDGTTVRAAAPSV